MRSRSGTDARSRRNCAYVNVALSTRRSSFGITSFRAGFFWTNLIDRLFEDRLHIETRMHHPSGRERVRKVIQVCLEHELVDPRAALLTFQAGQQALNESHRMCAEF
jgi:hypothetical protein